MKKKILILVLISTLLFSSIPQVSSIPPPVGIGGWVKDANGSYAPDGTPVYAKNLATGKIVYRSTGNGYYAIPISAQSGDNIKVTSYLGTGKTEKNIVVNLEKTTQWCNLSINSGSSNDNGGSENGNGGGSTPPSSPHANFAWTPLQPFENESVSFTDLSTDDDSDISSWVWTIDEQTIEQKNVEYIFTNPGNYLISLTVTDATDNHNTKKMTVVVSKEYTTPETNNTNSTSSQENITIIITTIDADNNTVANERISIYQNNTLIKTVYTDNNGTASVIMPPGSYSFESNSGIKNLTFANDGQVTFLLSGGEPVQGEITEAFPWLLAEIVGVICICIVATIFIFVRYYNKEAT